MREIDITRIIIKEFSEKLLKNLKVDVAIGGAGPSGLAAAYYLAKDGFCAAVFEKSLRVGGGMPGGGMMYNVVVFPYDSKEILNEFEIQYKEKDGYLVADSLESTAMLTAKAVKEGAFIFNLMNIEDVMIKSGKVEGVVINWSAVELAKLHVDPVVVESHYVIDATGHEAYITRMVEKKTKGGLLTPTGKIIGEGPMEAEEGERFVVEYTKEVYPGLFVCGMAVNATFGGPRMGPIFGGMLSSGKKVAELIKQRLKACK